uniref:Uncharacterized protein n=1 Tax=Eutreptiella gymnastica TaxID=73025 RepID=A0A7S4FT38_9EUGL
MMLQGTAYSRRPLCPETSSVLRFEERVVLAQYFQAQKCRGNRGCFLRTAVSSPAVREEKISGTLQWKSKCVLANASNSVRCASICVPHACIVMQHPSKLVRHA